MSGKARTQASRQAKSLTFTTDQSSPSILSENEGWTGADIWQRHRPYDAFRMDQIPAHGIGGKNTEFAAGKLVHLHVTNRAEVFFQNHYVDALLTTVVPAIKSCKHLLSFLKISRQSIKEIRFPNKGM